MAPKHTATPPRSATGDCKADIKVDDQLPTRTDLERAGEVEVFDKEKRRFSFKSLYAGAGDVGDGNNNEEVEDGGRKINCQEYIRALSQSIPPSQLSTLVPPPEIIVIGCGQPHLISMYLETTGCAYPVYADPSRKLFDILGMARTMSLGDKTPEYMQASLSRIVVRSIFQGLRAGRSMLSGGDFWQVGGEFLFEAGGGVSWCHRMRNTRDHAEIGETRKRLGLDGGFVRVEKKRWTTGLAGGLGRRLSAKRQSWHGRGRNSTAMNGKEASPTRKMMDQLREEGVVEQANGTAAGIDAAYEKLTSRGAASGIANELSKEEVSGPAVDGNFNEKANGAMDGATSNVSVDSATKEVADDTDVGKTADGHFKEPTNDHTDPHRNGKRDGAVNDGSGNGTINGHVVAS